MAKIARGGAGTTGISLKNIFITKSISPFYQRYFHGCMHTFCIVAVIP